jgi:hypothetical protein
MRAHRLPGTIIMVRTPTGMCWGHTRTEPSDQINTALDQMMGNVVRIVPAWGT